MLDDIEVQGAFIRALLARANEEVFVETLDLKARLEVYRRNFMQGYCNALRKTYAMTAVYLGDEAFTAATVRYVCAHRPLAGQLFATYGENFFEIHEDPIAKELSRLEWMLQLVVMSREDDSIHVFKSPYRIGQGYAALRAKGVVYKIEKEASHYLIHLQGCVPVFVPISESEYASLQLLRAQDMTG
jgi:hypothetical protein